jgi:protoheme IX farnesyltransferase
MSTADSNLAPGSAATWHDYYELGKPRVVALIVFTAIVGMFLAVPGLPPWHGFLFGTIGIGLAASSAAAINHVLDRGFDEKMARTRNRPIPTGHVTTRQALLYAGLLGVISMLVLVLLVNALTAALTFFSLIGYAVLYTVWLKHVTPQNIVIGGAAGAAPPVLGWCAITGTVDPYALLLFLIIFAWTPPHFWALAIARREDYARAGIPMLPVAYGVDFTAPAHPALYDRAGDRHAAAVRDGHERAPLFTRGRRARRAVPAPRDRTATLGRTRAPADARLPLFDQLPDGALCRAADRPLRPPAALARSCEPFAIRRATAARRRQQPSSSTSRCIRSGSWSTGQHSSKRCGR